MLRFKRYLEETLEKTMSNVNVGRKQQTLFQLKKKLGNNEVTKRYHKDTLFKNMNHKIKSTATNFSLTGAYDLNARLLKRSGKEIRNYKHVDKSPEGNERDNQKINHLRAAISSNKAPRDFIVHSGLRGDGASPEHSQKNKGQKFIHKFNKFISTSLNSQIAAGFARTDPKSQTPQYAHVAKIHIPKGSRGLYMQSHSVHSKGEHEYVLHDGSQVEFKSKPKINHDTKTVHWEGHLVHDGVRPTSYSKVK